MREYYLAYLLLLSNAGLTSGEFSSGRIHSDEIWVFVFGHPVIDVIGQLDFIVEYTVTNQCCPGIEYYNDDTWESVYQNNNMDCQSKISLAQALFTFENITGNLNSSSGNYSVQCLTNNATNLRQCSGTLRLYSVDNRSWSFAISHCNSTQGLNIYYQFTFTNGDLNWDRPEMATEAKRDIPEIHLIYFGISLLLFATSLYFAYQLHQRDMFHRAYKLFMTSLSCESVALLLDTVYRLLYVDSTQELSQLLNIGVVLHAASEIFFQALLVLLAFGWTITTARLSKNTQKKLSVFFFVYVMVYGVLFVLKQEAESSFVFSPTLARLYRLLRLLHPMLRVFTVILFLRGALSTVRQNPEKKRFYLHFAGFYSVWFLVQPLTFMAASFFVQEWNASETYHLLRALSCLLGFGGVLYIMLPSRANTNFPFHAHTNEVEPAREQYPLANFQQGDQSSNFNDNGAGSLETNPANTESQGIEDRYRVF